MRKKVWLIGLLLVIVLALIGLDQRMIVRNYTVKTDKVDAPVRLAVVTDFHGCDYGENAADLVQAVMELQPDAVLLVGDMFSADGDAEEELRMFRQLDSIAFTYYVTGNHEYWEYSVPQLLARIADTGVTVLDQNCAELAANGQTLNICGIPDPYANVNTWDALTSATGDMHQKAFTVLLAHRPELIEQYAAKGCFDLVVSGHAHGGQIRIPLLINGLFAPNQGWFPKYAGGMYEVEDTTLIVSRGLARESTFIPRIFNRPELVMIELSPSNQ